MSNKSTQSSTQTFSLKKIVQETNRSVFLEMVMDYDPDDHTTMPTRAIVNNQTVNVGISKINVGSAKFKSELVGHEGEDQVASYVDAYGYAQKVDETGSLMENPDGTPILDTEEIRLMSFHFEEDIRKAHSPGTFAPTNEYLYSLRASFGVPKVEIPNENKRNATDPDTRTVYDLDVTSSVGNLVEGMIKAYKSWPKQEMETFQAILNNCKRVERQSSTKQAVKGDAGATAEKQIQSAMAALDD